MIRAALYGRFSSDNQREESITAQFRDGREYCRKKGYTIVKTYADEAKSGTTTSGRDEYNRMLLDAQSGLFDVVIFHKVDRNARNEFDYYNTKRELQEAGVLYEYSRQEIDSSTPEGQMMESVMVGMAAYYSRNLAGEIKKGLRENAYAGKTTGGIPPYGYSTNAEKKLIINEDEAPAIKLIFSMYNSGKSYGEITNILTANGYFTRKGTPFKKVSLHDILQNAKYKGTLVLGKYTKNGLSRNGHGNNKNAQVFNDVIPPIIQADDWEKAQKIMALKKKRVASGKAKTVYALSGLIFCGKCGKPMAGHFTVDRTGMRRYYYRCRSCAAKSVRRDEIEDMVLQAIKKTFLTPSATERIKRMIRDEIEQHGQIDYKPEIERLTAGLVKEKRKLDNLYTLVESGEADEYDISRMKSVKNNISLLTQNLEDVKRRASITLSDDVVDTVLNNLRDFFETEKAPHQMKDLFRLLVKRVTVTDDEVVVVLMVTQERFELPTP